jgi:hypothetical protein
MARDKVGIGGAGSTIPKTQVNATPTDAQPAQTQQTQAPQQTAPADTTWKPGKTVVHGKIADQVGNGWNGVGKVLKNISGSAVGGFEALPFIGNKVAAKWLPAMFGRKAYQEEVDPGKVYRGSTLNGKKFQELASSGTIDPKLFPALKEGGMHGCVNLCLEDYRGDRPNGEKYGVHTKHAPVLDLSKPWPNGKEEMLGVVKFMNDPENQPCYVHCEAGKGRTSMAVACYEMAVMGKGVEAALEEARTHGCTQPDQLAFIKSFGQGLYNAEMPGYPLKPMTGDTLEVK